VQAQRLRPARRRSCNRAPPTGSLGFGEPEHPELPELAKDLVRGERARILPGIDVRIEFFAAEPLDGAAQLCVFEGK
jgi:hypothetical protein